MRKISESDIKGLNISSADCVRWVDDALRIKRKSLLPPKTSIHQDGHKFFNVMPCVIPDKNIAGVKVVTRYPEREPSLKSHILFYDNSDGNLKALIDADFITTQRTAAVAVHSVGLLAKKDYRSIAFIGLGTIGQATLKMYIETLNGKMVQIRLFNYKNRAENIVSMYKSVKNVSFSVFDSYEKMIDDCDVIVSAVTFAEQDFCDENLYKKGCLLVPIHTLGFQQCDLTFDKIFGDDYEHIKNFKYFNRFKSFNEVSDVLIGKCPGRDNNEQRIIAYNIGIALHDIFFASEIYSRLSNQA